jgi:hypothetical protein
MFVPRLDRHAPEFEPLSEIVAQVRDELGADADPAIMLDNFLAANDVHPRYQPF